MIVKFHFDPTTQTIVFAAGEGVAFDVVGECPAKQFMKDMNNAYIRMDKNKELKVVEVDLEETLKVA